MIDFGKLHQHINFEVAIFSRCRNIKGEHLGSSPSPGLRPLSLWVWFYNGSRQTQAAYQILNSLASAVAEILKRDPKILGSFPSPGPRPLFRINQNGETPYFLGETDFTVIFADPMFPIQYETFIELRLQQVGDFYEKPRFTMEHFKFWEPVKWALKIIGPKYQMTHPYAQSGWTYRLAYVAVALVWR